ncbi:MAG: hypothetical protein FWG66_01935 [Spirochaetes bacterium]|nr:hypothetical protein [Spirochaetota bacterium]
MDTDVRHLPAIFNYVNFENENLSFGLFSILAICVFMLGANVMRRKVPVLRRALMPTAVIAGLSGLALREAILAFTGINILSTVALSGLIYHLLPIAFIALCLREKNGYTEEFNRVKVKQERVTAARSGAVIISTYLFQGLIGISVSLLIGLTILPQLNPGTGIMLALGFGQGPQQANAAGYIWDAAGYMDAWGAGSARNFGLTIAAMGFLWASIPGIILINRIAKKKGIKIQRDEFQKSGSLASYLVEEPGEVPLSESIDKFSLQICMVGGVYFATICVIIGIEMLFRMSGSVFLIDLVPTIWGFAFMIAALIALLTKMILRHLVKSGVMHRKYPNSYMMNRISGAAFDMAIVAALCSISIGMLGSLWIPVIIMTTAGGLGCMLYLRFLCNRVYKDYQDEAFLAMYGMLVGTIVNGMILLREVDSEFKTPAGDDLVLGSSAAIALGIPVLLLIAQAPRAGNLWWVMLVIALYFIALVTFALKSSKKKADAG